MKGHDPEGRLGPKKPLPDTVAILEPSPDKLVSEPVSEQRAPAEIQMPQPHPVAAEQPAYEAGYQAEEPSF
jgi:small subunit ribosomal protein S3e